MIRRGWGLAIASALTIAVAVLTAPHHDPGGRAAVLAMAAQTVDLDRAAAALEASVALFEALEVKESLPANDGGTVFVLGDGVTQTDRISHIQHGGRVKSANSLVIAPASRYSARA